ncbi:hypothetical protein WG908_04405 [Sphingobium sp. AN641]|uniref:hypothetical protein n=1 Tax=Sphingobium sp. AN641 TaxID=3133443 RepID=UPI0030C49C57
MGIANLNRRARRPTRAAALCILTLLPEPTLAQQSKPAAASTDSIRIPLSDARNVGANSVRFSARQFSSEAPSVALFGATTATWHKARAALRQAAAEGHPVKGVFMGPTTETPSLEIYAKGSHVTNPIDPNVISQAEITTLLRDIYREYYPR